MRRKDIKCLKTSEYHKCSEKENDKTRKDKTVCFIFVLKFVSTEALQ